MAESSEPPPPARAAEGDDLIVPMEAAEERDILTGRLTELSDELDAILHALHPECPAYPGQPNQCHEAVCDCGAADGMAVQVAARLASPPAVSAEVLALVAEVREALGKATPGPWKRDRNWHVTGPDHTWEEDETLDYFPKWKRNQIVTHVNGPGSCADNCTRNPAADFELIASAPGWLSRLCAALAPEGGK